MFRVENELNAMDFRCAHVRSVRCQDGDLILELRNAVIIGHSCPELPEMTPCTLNDGEDRYALPTLRVTLRRFSCGMKRLEQHLTGSFVIYELRHDPATGEGMLSFYSRYSPGRFDVAFTAASSQCRWEGYGNVSAFVKDRRIRLQNQKNRGDAPLYGLIEQHSRKWYTQMSWVFESIGNAQLDFNWLITDAVCYPNNAEFDELLGREYCFLSGRALTEMVEREDFQWIWAVLSGFPKDVPLSEILRSPLPYADGYSGFWANPIALQHPLSEIEIVPWDSGLVLLLAKDKAITDRFQAANPNARDLEGYNREEV